MANKATWSTAYVNRLPDSAFLYIAPGGSKDSEGKTTPRSLRKLPVKDDTGAVDLPHLRAALSRLGQPETDIPAGTKERLAARARRMLDNASKATAKRLDAAVAKAREVLGR